MQISQTDPGTGTHVRVRGARWRVVDIRPYDGCQLVTLAGVAPPHLGAERRVLVPFDTLEPIDRVRRPRVVRPALWRRACRALIASDTPPAGLRSARHARIDVMPHQLEPALALLRGLGSRVLLADEVGLGKTIQAGIVISELHRRGCADRVLVLTPAGLREQWEQELSTRFALDAHVADAAALRRLTAMLPVGLNPWSTERIAIASIDYVKRQEVLPAVAAAMWDIVVVDEAHGVAGDSDRHAAVSAVASRAAYVLLLTATPHSGDRRSFASLCGLGSLDRDSLLVFRRTRSDIRGDAVRRVHALHVRPSAGETRMHALLDRYTSAIRAERDEAWLAASVLHKRALSSAWSLAQSIERRLDVLAPTSNDEGGEQLALPLGDPEGEHTRADEPPAWPAELGLTDSARETRLLRDLLSAARSAANDESKLDAVRRVLRRSNEPAIVFTEYRDTLLHVRQVLGLPAAVLHGGLTRDERAAALDDFSRRRRKVLLATDAAGEGLNLHEACRLVINLELPWNPMRLEQRIGRVDRIGQTRPVHAFHLIADGTGETRILARLKERIARARTDIGAPDPVGASGIDEEHAVARLVILGSMDEDGEVGPGKPDTTGHGRRGGACSAPGADQGRPLRPDATEMGCEAVSEAARLTLARSLTLPEDEGAQLLVEDDGPWILRSRRSSLRASLGTRVVLVWIAAYTDACGRRVEAKRVPTLVELSHLPGIRDRAWVETLLRRIDPEARSLIEASTAVWRLEVERIARAFASRRLARERAMAVHAEASKPDVFQPGLFDRRAEHTRLIAAANRQVAAHDLAARIAWIELSARLSPAPPRLALILIP